MEINGAIRDVIELTRDEATKKGVSILTHFAESPRRLHGGRMWAGANEPRGASFQFTLPLERDENVPAGHVGSSLPFVP